MENHNVCVDIYHDVKSLKILKLYSDTLCLHTHVPWKNS